MQGERRQLTVMFCDLVGSTELSTRLDPEDLREVIRAYQDTCAKVIAQYDGFIAKYMGDGVLIYFGYPRAHENDAERALRAALAIVYGVPELNANVGVDLDTDLAVRIGIATGIVVVGQIVGESSREHDMTVNVVKTKGLSNVRESNKEATVTLKAPRLVNLEGALEYIESDELVEITPKSTRLRKTVLDHNVRKRIEKLANPKKAKTKSA